MNNNAHKLYCGPFFEKLHLHLRLRLKTWRIECQIRPKQSNLSERRLPEFYES